METHVSRVLRTLRTGGVASGGTRALPYILVLQSASSKARLANAIPAIAEFPVVKIHVADPTNLLSVLDWAAIATRRLIQHFLNSFVYLQVSWDEILPSRGWGSQVMVQFELIL